MTKIKRKIFGGPSKKKILNNKKQISHLLFAKGTYVGEKLVENLEEKEKNKKKTLVTTFQQQTKLVKAC